MPDTQSLSAMMTEHNFLFGKNILDSIATDNWNTAERNRIAQSLLQDMLMSSSA